MDLRDRFAAHFAGALVDAFSDPDRIATRAYELAEAMLRERERRVDEEEGAAIRGERGDAPPDAWIAEEGAPLHEEGPFAPEDDDHRGSDVDEAYHAARAALLDDPEPMEPEAEWLDDEEIPDWLDAPYDPRWELEARWSSAPPPEEPPRRASSRPPRPGLARTEPEAVPASRPARSGGSAG